jgi:adenylate cyclase
VAAEVDIAGLGLLDGLDGEARSDRAELIDWLLKRGFSIDQIHGSAASPLLLPMNRVLGDDGTLVSARDICAATGLDLELLERLRAAIGLPGVDDPDAAVLPRVDGEVAAHASILLGHDADRDDVLAILRVLTEGLQRAAALMRHAAFRSVLRPGASEIAVAEAIEGRARKTVAQLGPMIENLLLLQMRQSFETEAINAAERAAGELPGARMITVAFADVAGFTRLGESLPPGELLKLVRRIADLARAAALSPVRFVKTIGDAVMLVSPDPGALLNCVLQLVEAGKREGLPQLRCGVASGMAVSRAGDWFGSPVNLASRVTGAARPGTVLVTQSARESAGDAEGLAWSHAGARPFKGLSDDVELFEVARRAD